MARTCSSLSVDNNVLQVIPTPSKVPLKCITQPFVTRYTNTAMQFNVRRITLRNVHPNLRYRMPLSALNACGEGDIGVRDVYERRECVRLQNRNHK